MKVTTLKKSILLTIACIGTGLAPSALAAHATNFLDALQNEVTTRLNNVSDSTPAAEKRALTSASRTLSHNSGTLSSDLGELASSATALNNAFPGDATFGSLENDAVNNYSAEAQSELNAVADRAGTNAIPPALSNQLSQAQASLDRANDSSNSIPVRARAVSFALNKIRVADILATHLFKAPLSLDGTTLTLKGRESDHDAFNVTLSSNHSYVIAANGMEAEEDGTWDYARTSSNTGTLTLMPTGGGAHTLDLKFANSTKGTFTGQNAGGEAVRGVFTIASP